MRMSAAHPLATLDSLDPMRIAGRIPGARGQ